MLKNQFTETQDTYFFLRIFFNIKIYKIYILENTKTHIKIRTLLNTLNTAKCMKTKHVDNENVLN